MVGDHPWNEVMDNAALEEAAFLVEGACRVPGVIHGKGRGEGGRQKGRSIFGPV
jgi:hypothetical protein